MDGARALLRRLLGARTPTVAGTLRVPGVSAPVTIRRDGHGVPHISAATDADAAFGLGFATGQDRAFQLEMLLRTVRGTLAELLGARGLPIDRLARRIGFRSGVAEQLAASRPEVRTWVDGYARGITAGATRGLPRRPHEFALLAAHPTPWDRADVLAVARLMAFLLSPSWSAQYVRLEMALADGPEAVLALDPPYPAEGSVVGRGADGDVVADGVAGGDGLADDLARFAAAVGAGGASNAWALAGERTTSGRPLLAADPHLMPGIPPAWYLAHVRTPAWEVAGASFVGLGMIPIGHNGTAAWGITAGMVDTTELVVERLDGDRVLVGDRWVPCRLRVERIRVRGGRTVDEPVLVTPNGPIVSPALANPSRALALRATWLRPAPADLLLLHRIRDFEELRRVGAPWAGASLNILWADASGTIGWQLVGRPPARDGHHGTFPPPGWLPAGRWDGRLLAPEDMPWDRDPGTGVLVSANNRPTVAHADRLGRDWLDTHRAGRIEELLAARDDWDVAGCQTVQLDVTSTFWRDIADVVLTAPVADADGRLAVRLLRDWDGEVAGDSAAASVFELTVSALFREVVAARAPATASWALGAPVGPLLARNYFPKRRATLLTRLLHEQPEGWLDRSWADAVAAALSGAVRDLRAGFGTEPTGWAWGRVRPLTLPHALGRRPPLGRVFDLGPIAAGGDHETPAQHGVDPADPSRPPLAYPSLRAVMDPGAPGACRFALPGGQSGNPTSPHYADQLPAYLDGGGVPIAWEEAEVARATRTTLRLVPG